MLFAKPRNYFTRISRFYAHRQTTYTTAAFLGGFFFLGAQSGLNLAGDGFGHFSSFAKTTLSCRNVEHGSGSYVHTKHLNKKNNNPIHWRPNVPFMGGLSLMAVPSGIGNFQQPWYQPTAPLAATANTFKYNRPPWRFTDINSNQITGAPFNRQNGRSGLAVLRRLAFQRQSRTKPDFCWGVAPNNKTADWKCNDIS